VEAEPASDLRSASAEQLRGRIAFDQRRGGDAARLLLSAARRFEPFDAGLARDTYLEALEAAILEGGSGGDANMAAAAEAARNASPKGDATRGVEFLLDALSVRLTEGYVARRRAGALASVTTATPTPTTPIAFDGGRSRGRVMPRGVGPRRRPDAARASCAARKWQRLQLQKA
jgi:hypothetical protein